RPVPDEGGKGNGKEKGKRQTYRIDYSLSRMDDVYELRVPRLQIVGGAGTGTGARTSLANSVSVSAAEFGGDVASMSTSASGSAKEGKEGPAVDEEKRALRREIKAWWEGVADHLDGLVDNANTHTGNHHRREHARRVPQGAAAAALRGRCVL
ncbi:hypothetical protein B0H14DRAFT_2983246, partial [Mycena olivaceomarginata]